MKSHLNIVIAVAMCLCIASVSTGEESDQASPLQGEWILLQGESNGKTFAQLLKDRGFGGMRIKFADDLMIMTGFGGPDHKWQFTLRPMSQPKEILLVSVETHGKTPKGTTLTGIYELDGEVLKLCLPGDSTMETPKKFEAPSGSRLSLLTLKRQSNEDKSPTEP